MNQLDIGSSISTQYINDIGSVQVRILMKSGNTYSGKFIKANQKVINSSRNKWIITIDHVDLMVDGNDIDSFFPFKHDPKP